MKQKTIGTNISRENFDDLCNKFKEEHNVKFEQTHIFSLNDGIMYEAVLFYDDSKEVIEETVIYPSNDKTKERIGVAWNNKKFPNKLNLKFDGMTEYEFADKNKDFKRDGVDFVAVNPSTGDKIRLVVNEKKKQENHPDYLIYKE